MKQTAPEVSHLQQLHLRKGHNLRQVDANTNFGSGLMINLGKLSLL